MARHESNGLRFHTVVAGWGPDGRALGHAHLVEDGNGATGCGRSTMGMQGVPDDSLVSFCRTCLRADPFAGVVLKAKAVRQQPSRPAAIESKGRDVVVRNDASSMAEPREHRLAAKVRAVNVPLWRLRLALGGSPCEGSLSRKLRGLEPMGHSLATQIDAVLDELK